jgi:hypothetical protein
MNRRRISLTREKTKNKGRDKGAIEIKARNPNFKGCSGFFKTLTHPCYNGGAQ